jgi:uncharacterized protein with ParB-like and HNH nuclease domain
MEAGKRSINDIFNGHRILEIPFFQRSYVWKDQQWERFIQDMEYISSTNKPHFLGSVIMKQKLTDATQLLGDCRTVIDGQQRLTTLCIFLKVLSQKRNNPYLASIFRLPMFNNKIALIHNHNDIDSFEYVLNLSEETDIIGKDCISNAYMYFRKHIKIENLNEMHILNNIMFVGIDLSADEDEQQIFDTINSLGVKLTTAELLKNYLFGKDNFESYNSYWKDIFERDEQTNKFWDTEIVAGRLKRSLIDMFLYAFLQIQIQDKGLSVNNKDKSDLSKVDGLFNSYKAFIKSYKIDKADLIKDIRDYAIVFRENLNMEIIDAELSSVNYTDRINAIVFGLENTTLLPYILFILKNVKDQDEKNAIFKYLESFIMRRIVCRSNNKNYNQLFGERLISYGTLTRNALQSSLVENEGVNYFPSDNELREAFHSSQLTNKQAAGVLYFIESGIRNVNKHASALLGLEKYSLEHIMPKKWENHWNGISTAEEKINRNRKLLTLGNLTIITASLNSSIRDGNWDTKRNGKNSRPGLKHYAAGLDTISPYFEKEIWDERAMEMRADFLFEKAAEIWPLQ